MKIYKVVITDQAAEQLEEYISSATGRRQFIHLTEDLGRRSFIAIRRVHILSPSRSRRARDRKKTVIYGKEY